MGMVAHTNDAAILALYNYYPKDNTGWSIIVPSADSRLIYVSETGNDGTAQDYTLATLPNINNWNNPGAVSAYQTIDAAKARLRSGFPDWMLIQRGDMLQLFANNFDIPAGRSVTERTVIAAYGTGDRPHINPTQAKSLRVWGDDRYIAIKGIKILPTYRDPAHADFAGWGNVAGTQCIRLFDDLVGSRNVLIEDCWLEFGIDGITTSLCSDVIIRRNIIMHAYDENAHAQGIFSDSGTHILEENFCYHNGWYKQAIDPLDPAYPGNSQAEGQATIFNHNMYLAAPSNSIVRNNISIAPSSMHVKTTASAQGGTNTVRGWEIIGDNNLMIDGEVGISVGGNADADDGPRYRDIRICRNVTTRQGESEQTDRQLGWGDDYQDWDGGFVGQNLSFKNGSPIITNVYAREISGHMSNVAVTRNVDVDMGGAVGQGSGAGSLNYKAQGANMVNVLDAYNIVSNANTDGKIVKTREVISGITHRDNKYHSSRPAAEWFNYNGSDTDKAGWDSSTGDTGSTTTPITFVDPNRTIETYMTTLGQTATLAEFIEKCKQQGNGAWDRDYTARYINAYCRAGYKET